MSILIWIFIGFILGGFTSYAILDKKYKNYYNRKIKEIEKGLGNPRRGKSSSFNN